MFQINDRDIKKFEQDLKQFASRSLPYATRQAINNGAFQAQKIAKADISKEMILRNKYTINSIRVNQTRTLNIQRQEALIGSTADYMEMQEFGGIENKTGKVGVAIPTSYSAGQAINAQPRTKLPRKPNKISNIHLKAKKIKAKSRKQKNFIAIRQASEQNSKFVFLDLGNSKGIFKVTGKKKKIKIRMVHDLSRNTVIVPKNPWLKPSVDEAARMIPAFYADALRFQLRRNNLFK